MILVRGDQIEPKPAPSCPECGEEMPFYGGTAGYIHCGWKLLYRSGGWFDPDGSHIKDPRLTGDRIITTRKM